MLREFYLERKRQRKNPSLKKSSYIAEKILKFSSHQSLLCLTHIGGGLEKAPKIPLLKEYETRFLSDDTSNISNFIVDGMHFLECLI